MRREVIKVVTRAVAIVSRSEAPSVVRSARAGQPQRAGPLIGLAHGLQSIKDRLVGTAPRETRGVSKRP